MARTFLDVAAASRTQRLQRMLERSEELKLFDLRLVESVLKRNQGHHGVGSLRRALALYKPSPFNRSGVEMIRVTEARLEREPAPVLHRVARLLADRTPTTGRKPT